MLGGKHAKLCEFSKRQPARIITFGKLIAKPCPVRVLPSDEIERMLKEEYGERLR